MRLLLEKMRLNEFGRHATVIGEIVVEHAGMVAAKTGIGGTRVVDLQLGEQLPRIYRFYLEILTEKCTTGSKIILSF